MLLLRLNLQNRDKFGLYINLCIFEVLRENLARKVRGQPLKVLGLKINVIFSNSSCLVKLISMHDVKGGDMM